MQYIPASQDANAFDENHLANHKCSTIYLWFVWQSSPRSVGGEKGSPWFRNSNIGSLLPISSFLGRRHQVAWGLRKLVRPTHWWKAQSNHF